MKDQLGSVLATSAIRENVENGNIEIDPFDPKQLNSASYDLLLGDTVSVYSKVVMTPSGGEYFGSYWDQCQHSYLNLKEENDVEVFKIPEKGMLLKPGIGYLMHTKERIKTDKFVPIVDGKSSIGRYFIKIHITAGFGDPGFNGQYTLEVEVTHPVVIYPNIRIGQIRFHTIMGEPKLYESDGKYTGDKAMGPVGSQYWKNFDEKDR